MSEAKETTAHRDALADELARNYIPRSTFGRFTASSLEYLEAVLALGLELRSAILSDDPEWDAWATRLRTSFPTAPVLRAADAEVHELEVQLRLELLSGTQRSLRDYPSPSAPPSLRASFSVPRAPDVRELLESARRVVVCDSVHGFYNTASIVRAAAELGFDAVLYTIEKLQPFAQHFYVKSGGASLGIPVVRLPNWPDEFSLLEEYGFTTVAAALRADALDIRDPQLKAPARIAVILGSEHAGLSEQVLARCAYTAVIPMRPGIDSLNVANAAAIALYELGGAQLCR